MLGLWTLATIPFFALLLWLGWQKVKHSEPKSELYS
jgi:L-asparagine permease